MILFLTPNQADRQGQFQLLGSSFGLFNFFYFCIFHKNSNTYYNEY